MAFVIALVITVLLFFACVFLPIWQADHKVKKREAVQRADAARKASGKPRHRIDIPMPYKNRSRGDYEWR